MRKGNKCRFSSREYGSLKLIAIIVVFLQVFGLLVPGSQGMANVFADVANHVVISEVYGGGGNTGAPLKSDFVELYNPTDSDVDLTGWSLQYASATGVFQTTLKCNLNGTIYAHGYYLIKLYSGTTGADLPAADATGSTNISGTNGKVALASSSSTLVTGPNDAIVVDFVGYGSTANMFEGSAAAPSPSNTTSIERLANDGDNPTTVTGEGKGNGWDTSDNKSDFIACSAIIPQNTASPTEDLTVEEDTTPPVIEHDPIASAVVGNAISLEAVVTDGSGVSSVELYYGSTPDGNGFTSVPMDNMGENNYKAELNPTQSGSLYYYIKAADTKGNFATLPGDTSSCYQIIVEDGDLQAPAINHTPVTQAAEGIKIDISATITDMSPVTAYLYYRNIGTQDYKDLTMLTVSGSVYTAEIPAVDVVVPGIEYYIEAKDLYENTSKTNVYTINVSNIPTIAQARANPVGTIVTTQGVVTFIDGSNYYIQDATAAIDLYRSGLSLMVGDLVKATGPLKEYSKLLEIAPASAADVTVVSSGNVLPNPRIVAIPDINENIESQLVKIENVILGATNTATNNTPVTDSSNNTINIYKMPALTGIVAGDRVNVTAIVSQFNTIYQLRVRSAADVEKVTVPDTTPPTIIQTPVTQGNMGLDLAISAIVNDDQRVAGVKLYYRVKGQSSYTFTNMTLSGSEYSAVIPKAELSTLGMEYYIEATDGTNVATSPMDTNNPYQVAIMDTDVTAPVISEITPVEGSDENPVRPVISAKYNDASGIDSATVKLTLDNVDVTADATKSAIGVSYTPIADLVDGLHSVKVEVADLAGNKAEKSWNFYVGKRIYKNYFGQLHSHTAENSDGSGTLAEAYQYARDTAKLDFFAVTDHSNSFDNKPSGDKAGTYNLGAYNKDDPEWVNGQQAAASARRDNFISVYAYEMTWSGGPGHMNTFATEGFVSRNNTELNAKTGDAGLQAYYQLLKDTPNSISQFNHPGPTFGDFSDFSYLDPIIDARVSLIEVGNGEGAVGSGAYFPSYDEYNKALDKGWHLAPTNNQDNHKGKWGNANSARTVIYADDLSVNGLYDALRDMRVYSTEDENLDIVYTLNGEVLGSIIQDVPGQADFDVSVEDPDSADNIQSISIISNGGKEIYSQTYSAQNALLDKTIDSPAAGYYYIKVVEKDGQIAVTAPIWIGSAPRVGIDSVQYDTLMPVTGEQLTFTTKLFNNESSSATIKTLAYKIKDGATIAANDLNATIASSAMYTHTQSHVFTEPGIFTVTVTAVISQNGNDTTYTKDIEVNVRDSEKLVYLGIDASHDNEYVSGNYKASMSNFARLAAKFNARVVELNTSDALIGALNNPKYQMMVFTVPSRRNGTTGRIPFKSYSQAEIDAVKAFAEAGKTVVVTGWGDYYENYSNLKSNPGFTADQHMAAQQNKLLVAIGASLRIADDEAKDNTKNGGQSQRLYLTEYNNFADPFTQGIVDGQVFSQYGGSTVYAADSNGNPLNELPSGIKPTISGHETTFSSDDDKDSNAIPPKYNNRVLLMANETVTHADGTKSTVIAAGGAFMSNFEIQVEVENAGTLPYSNYNILQNIIASLANISNIADIHNMPNGTNAAIEGIATTGVYNGSDGNRGFFDCIYVQDETGGINLFPVSSGVEAGQKIRVTGIVSEYQGEKQLQNAKVTVINSGINPVAPKPVTPLEAMSPENTGSLVVFTGTVTEIKTDNDGVVGQLMVSGARVYINGYITKNVSLSNIRVGDTVKVTGIASIGENMSSDTEFLPRIRIRDRGEITIEVTKVTGVTLNNPIASIEVGKTVALTAAVQPANATNKNVTWSSSDTGIAAVENGVVTGVAEGEATITATTEDGGYTATCTVTVLPIAVTGVTLDKTEAEVKIGRELTLTATVAPNNAKNKAVLWNSSNPEVAKVIDGKVVGVAEGSAVITVTTVDGGFTAACVVNVTPVPVEGISLDITETNLTAGKTLKLTASISPEDATNKAVVWSSSDESVAKVENGLVTAFASGTALISVTTADGNKTAECKITVIPATTLKVTDFEQPQGKLTVTMSLVGAKNVSAQDIVISYDKNALKLQSVDITQGGLLLIQQRSKKEGTVRVVISSNGGKALINGDKDIFNLVFKTVKGYASADIKVVKAVLADGQGVEVTAEPSSITVDTKTGKTSATSTIAAARAVKELANVETMFYPSGKLTIDYDVNNDGNISIGDLGIVAYNQGKTRLSKDWDSIKAADLIRNGIIGYEDMLMIVKELLK